MHLPVAKDSPWTSLLSTYSTAKTALLILFTVGLTQVQIHGGLFSPNSLLIV